MNTKIITLLAILAMYFNSTVAQQVYNTPSMSYQGGRQVSTFDNDKLTLSVSGYMDKVSYNGKELFLNIAIISKVDGIEINPNTITAYVEKRGSQKEVKVYNYKDYLAKVKRNFLLWGPNTTKQSTIETNSKTDINGNVYSDQGNHLHGDATVNTNSKSTITQHNDDYDVQKQDAISYVNNYYLRRNTLNAGNSVQGIVACKNPGSTTTHIIITIAGDKYELTVNLDEQDE